MDSIYLKTQVFLRERYGMELDELEPDFRLSDGNSKLAKDGIESFNLVPEIHCPMAGVCVNFCYAKTGHQAFKAGVLRRIRAYLATRHPEFVQRMVDEIKRSIRRGCRGIRIHDSGDFYSWAYFMAWLEIARQLPEIPFYAYTKSISLVQRAHRAGLIPDNFRFIQSEGGLEDARIDYTLPHARIFKTQDELATNGYSDASASDAPAAFTKDVNVGLVIHGAKKNNFSKGA